MLLGVYKKFRKPSLYINIESVRALCREHGWRVAFRAVPRQMNSVADDMCRRAESAKCKVFSVEEATQKGLHSCR